MAIKKVKIPKESLPPVNENGEYVVRYRIVSDDKNRFSQWSNQYVIQAPQQTLDPDENIYLNIADTFISVNWEDGTPRTYDVFVTSGETPDLFNQNIGTASNSGIGKTLIQPDGKLVLTGNFTLFNGTPVNRLIRLNSNGTLDTLFNTNIGTGFNSNTQVVAIQSDGKILVGGNFTTFNGNTRNRLVRLNSDGTEDTSFYTNLGSGFSNNSVLEIAIQSDGKILVGGNFTTFNGNTRNRLVRLNSDGTEDAAFYTSLGTAVDGSVNSVQVIRLQSDGKILIGGDITSFNGSAINKLIRLNNNLTLDTSFSTNLGSGFSGAPSGVYEIKLQSDGKILVGGQFTAFNGNTRNNLVRLNSDGTEDVAFYTALGSGFLRGTSSAGVLGISIQSDNKIIISGSFTTLNGISRNGLVRLNNNGTEDAVFYNNLGSGFSPEPSGRTFKNLLLADGKIIVVGSFTTLNGQTANRIVKLNSDGVKSFNDTSWEQNFNFFTTVNGQFVIIPITETFKDLVRIRVQVSNRPLAINDNLLVAYSSSKPL